MALATHLVALGQPEIDLIESPLAGQLLHLSPDVKSESQSLLIYLTLDYLLKTVIQFISLLVSKLHNPLHSAPA